MKVVSKVKKSDNTQEVDEKRNDEVVVKSRSNSQSTIIEVQEHLPMSAFVTILFLFFQVASLVQVTAVILSDSTKKVSARDEAGNTNTFTQNMFDIANFRFTLYNNLCPTDELNLIQKMFINAGLKFCSIINIILFYILWLCFIGIRMIWNNLRKKKDEKKVEHDEVKGELSPLSQKPGNQIRSQTNFWKAYVMPKQHFKAFHRKL